MKDGAAAEGSVAVSADGVDGFLHAASGPDGLVLTHGAGGNAAMPLLVAVAKAFVEAGVTVLRCNLPFRQTRTSGPPSPANAATDQEGLRLAAERLRRNASGRIFLGGQSYGGRMASMLAASDSGIAQGLLLLSYPLHPPGRPEKLRTAHFPSLRTRTLFVLGTKDPFAGVEELELQRKLIPAATVVRVIDGAGHDLKRGKFDVASEIAAPFLKLLSQ